MNGFWKPDDACLVEGLPCRYSEIARKTAQREARFEMLTDSSRFESLPASWRGRSSTMKQVSAIA
jgi:hypothetical protein